MEVKILTHTPLSVCSHAIRQCWDSFDKGGNYPEATDDIIEADKALIDRIGNKAKHESVKNHLVVVAKVDDEVKQLIQYNQFFKVLGNTISYSLTAIQKLQISNEDKLKLLPDSYHYLLEV